MVTDGIISPVSPESPSTTPTHESSAPILRIGTYPNNEEEDMDPLYTEINIPLPRLPSPPASRSPPPTASLSPPPQSHSRSRSRSLSLFRPSSRNSADTPRSSAERKSEDTSRRVIRNRDIVAAMDLSHQGKRNRRGTIDALAVVPAVLVLSAELFTPGEGKESRGRLGEGIR